MNLKIGDTVFVFESERRSRDDDTAEERYRRRFVEKTIAGETKQSWLVGEGYRQVKVSKKTMTYSNGSGLQPGQVWTTKEAVEDEIFRMCWCHRIGDRVKYATAEQLKQIAAIVGWEKPE